MTEIKVNTRFGELSVDPAQVITFPKGIPGFEKNTKWKLFHEIDEQGNVVNGMVIHLQSIEDGEVSLPLTDPVLFGFNFDLTLTEDEISELQIEDTADVIVLTVLSVKSDASQSVAKKITGNMYANISAPILINIKSRRGMQKILIDKP
jgi:flagellar assembly factor FliW